MTRKATIEYLKILEEEVRRNKKNKLRRVYESFYDWQRQFNAATKEHDSCLLLAGNQVGKTRTGTAVDAHHLLGEYPDDWEGIKFDFPPVCWLLGYSGEKTRDLLQTKLFGRFLDGKFEGGYIPAEMVVDYRSMTGTSGAMREVRVKHKHGISVCQFWSYSQGQAALMGDVVDWYHIDEEPKDEKIFPQVLTRTINGNRGKGGSGILTFTPENGKTQLVCKFMGEDAELDESNEEVDFGKTGMYMQSATWDQAPHISEGKKKKILAQYPSYQRKMRSEGQPLMGSGLIFEIDEDDLKCDPFDVPDHWFVINGLDLGWDHPQAHVQLVWDRDADIFYVINAWKGRKKQPYEAWHIVKPWAQNVPYAWPADGLQTEKGSAKQQVSYYADEGFNMLPEHATFEDGGNGVWAGIAELHNLMKTGRLKIVRSLHPLFEEIRQYHTKTVDEGRKIKIVDIKDDLICSLRYAYMMRRYAVRIMDLYPQEYDYNHRRDEGRDAAIGY
jgi:phage terminase large subunit-like protein